MTCSAIFSNEGSTPTSFWPDGAGRLLFQSTCSSQRSKLWPPRSSSGRRGLGQALKPKLARSGASANRKLGSFLLSYRIAQKGTQTIHAFGGHGTDCELQGR